MSAANPDPDGSPSLSMIIGTGIDIVEVRRIQSAYARFGGRFLNRILRPTEITYCLSRARPPRFVAARFAAKEAAAKAFGTGIGGELSWQDLEVGRKESGEPFLILHQNGRRLLSERGGGVLHLTLSHTEDYAAAMAILESHSFADRSNS